MMELKEPFQISARLMAAVQIADAWISVGYGKATLDRRMEFEIYIDIGKRGYKVKELRSGIGSATIQEGFVTLLSFLSAAGESYGHRIRMGEKHPGENEIGFDPNV